MAMGYRDRNRRVAQIKRDLYSESVKCYFCNATREIIYMDTVHLIRRSHAKGLIDCKENIVLGCRDCHDIFDNKFSKWEKLNQGNLITALLRIKGMDELYFNRLIIKANEAGWTGLTV